MLLYMRYVHTYNYPLIFLCLLRKMDMIRTGYTCKFKHRCIHLSSLSLTHECIHTYPCVCTYTYAHVQIRTWAHICTHIHTLAQTHTCYVSMQYQNINNYSPCMCHQICENPPHMHRMMKHSFHYQSVAL